MVSALIAPRSSLQHFQAHLVAFFKQAYEDNTNSFRHLAEQYLSGPEKDVLATVLQTP